MTKYLEYQEVKRFIPDHVGEVLSVLSHVGFFERSVLIGSWAMFYYRAIHNIDFALVTSDIDLAVLQLATYKEGTGVDLEKVLQEIGAIPDFSSDGLQRFIIPGFRIEFIVHDKGSRTKDSGVTLIREWNIHAQPLPFIRMLLNFTERVDTDDFYIRIPVPEAFFVHKLIIANRRTDRSKRGKDLAQCRSLSGILDDQILQNIANSAKLGPRTKKHIQTSCERIDFPYKRLGI